MGIYIVYFLSLLAIGLLVMRAKRIPESLFNGIRLLGGHGFSANAEELPKFALIRIGLGFVVAWRGLAVISHLSLSDFDNDILIFYACLNVMTGVLLLFGFLTQYAILYLVFLQWQIGDAVLGVSTLGNDIGAILAVLLFVVNAGRTVSFDACLLESQKFGFSKRLLLYYRTPANLETIHAAKFVALFSYWLVCVYSLAMHVSEPAWMSGAAGPLLLSNNFMSVWHAEFSRVFMASSESVYLAKIALWLMMPWYLLVLPFVLLGGLCRKYVIVWGWLFFIFSAFVLQLGWLAEIEFLLWAAIFWSKFGVSQVEAFEVAFDDKCNLCDKTVKVVRVFDIFDRVKLLPLSGGVVWLDSKKVSLARAQEDIHGYDSTSGYLYAGYEFYCRLSRELVLLWPLYPALLIGKWLKAGPAIYSWIAVRRRVLFGVCNLPSPKKNVRQLACSEADKAQVTIAAIVIIHVLLLGFSYFLAIPSPYLGHEGWKNRLAQSAHIYGITPIDVFNKSDLKMAENWFTLSVKTGAGERLLPILQSDGSRLAYHASDRIYFGNTLKFRRDYIDKNGCFFESERQRMNYLVSVALRKSDMDDSAGLSFVYRQYYQSLPDDGLIAANLFVPQSTVLRCEVVFTVGKD